VRRDVPIFTLLNENDSQIQENLYKKSSNKVESKHMFNNVNGNVCFDKTSIWSITVVLTRNTTSLSGISITISIYIIE
jgi:hypothetical protein